MGYYDNVKDDVAGKEGSNSNAPSFDTLKEAAEESSNESDENKGDGTPIEVLEDGGLDQQRRQQQNKRQVSQQPQNNVRDNQVQQSQDSVQQNSSREVDLSSLEDKMDRMIEQNQRMIEILESFGQ